jgi:hypothetical protein
MPDEFQQGAMISTFLIIYDQFSGNIDRPFLYGGTGLKNPSVALGLGRCGEAACSTAVIRSRADRGRAVVVPTSTPTSQAKEVASTKPKNPAREMWVGRAGMVK